MNRFMMLALAMSLPLTQACDDTNQIKEKAAWVCQHTRILDEVHVLDLHPETHPIREYVVDADVDFTERKLDGELAELRRKGGGWDIAYERIIMATGRVATSNASCEVDSLERIALGERYRVELTLEQEFPNTGAPLERVVSQAMKRVLNEKGLGDLVVLVLFRDITSMVPPQAEVEAIFEEEWDRAKVVKKQKKVSFDMVREDGVWKAELDLRVEREEPEAEVVVEQDDGAQEAEAAEAAEEVERAWEQVSRRWSQEVEESREQVERSRTEDVVREEIRREVRRQSREVRVVQGDPDESRALRERIESLEREVRRLERRDRFDGFDDDIDIEIRF